MSEDDIIREARAELACRYAGRFVSRGLRESERPTGPPPSLDESLEKWPPESRDGWKAALSKTPGWR